MPDQPFKNVVHDRNADGSLHACPCCRYRTLATRGEYEICPVCYWEDDGQDEHDADVVRGGPNYTLSLTEARQNFQKFKACEQRFIKNVRPPRSEEM
jgi:hypothetical protein